MTAPRLDDLRILTVAFDAIPVTARAEALSIAERAGREAAEADPPDAADAPDVLDPFEYQLRVVEPAFARGAVAALDAERWRVRCFTPGDATRDPRVTAFFLGWSTHRRRVAP